MKASVERLRWGLAGAAVLLLVVLAGFVSYGRYKARKVWQGIVARSGIHISKETDGFTYSQSVQKRTVFTLHAAKAIQHGDGKWTLHDVVVTLYSKTSTDEDHIYSSDIEYDEKTGVATAVGEVHMDLQAPGALAHGGARPQQGSSIQATPVPARPPGGGAEEEAEGDHIIHVRTSGLVYVRKLSVAATDQPVEFRYAGMQCTSMGAEFDSSQSLLHLLADVVMTGTVRNSPMIVHAVKADLDRDKNTITLAHPVAESQGRTAAAANALLHLRHDGSLEQAEGGGGVAFNAGTRHVTASSFAGTFGLTSLPTASKLLGNVVMTDSSATRPLHSQADEVDGSFDALGNPATVLAVGKAQVAFSDRKPGSPDLPREMRGDRILATFVPVNGAGKRGSARKATTQLSELHAMGSAMARGASVATVAGKPASAAAQAPELKSTEVSADDLRALFDAAGEQQPQLRQVFGKGHARLLQKAPLGEEQTSSSDTLQVDFAKGVGDSAKGAGALEIASAVETGSVTIHSKPAARTGAGKVEEPSDASAARAMYDGATQKLMLTGAAHFTQGQTSLTAATIAVNQSSGDAEAAGGVLATMSGAQATSPKTAVKPTDAPMTHVAADHAMLRHDSQVAEFTGSDAHPARLWQGGSQVQAADLLFDQKRRSLAARPGAGGGLVHAVFASQGSEKKPATPAGKAPGKDGDQIVRVVSPAMDYDDGNREATFTGGVRIDGATGQARSQRAVVFLNPAQAGAGQSAGQQGAGQANPFGGSVRRVVLSGDVRLDQPGRTGTGEQLVYTAADSSYILTGTPSKPPHVVDAQQGNVTGATLLFHSGDSTIVVGGTDAGAKAEKPGRVRTETRVKQQ
jgi:lipopolysaccharide export system protein LptA